MYLTKYQKSLCRKIRDREITDVYSFLKLEKVEASTFPYNSVSYSFSNLHIGVRDVWVNLHNRDPIYIISNNEYKELKNHLSEFVILCDKIEIERLIRATRMSGGKKFIPILIKTDGNLNTQLHNEINQILFERYDWVFNPTAALDFFIKAGFKTDFELIAADERESRDKMYELSRKTSSRQLWISGILAGLTLLALLYNILNIAERNVTLKNQKDTIYIKQIYIPPAKDTVTKKAKDSVGINNKR